MLICLSVFYIHNYAQYCSCTCDDVFIADVSSGVCDTGDHRLVDGTDYEGRVEVCVDGEWGSVCSIDSWGGYEATVACRATYGTSSGGHDNYLITCECGQTRNKCFDTDISDNYLLSKNIRVLQVYFRN